MARTDFNFHYPFKIRYSEIDMQGVVYNSHYLTFMDVSATEYFRWLGFDMAGHVEATGQDFHTVHASLDYRSPCRFEDEIEVCIRTAEMGRSSLTMAVEIFLKGEDEVKTSGRLIWVNTDQTDHRSRPLPQKLIDLVNRVEGI